MYFNGKHNAVEADNNRILNATKKIYVTHIYYVTKTISLYPPTVGMSQYGLQFYKSGQRQSFLTVHFMPQIWKAK